MVSVAFLASGMTVAQAADYYWDANGVGAGTGGSGTWTTTNTWRTGSATGTLVSWPGATNNAFMEGTAGVLTLSSSVTMGASGTAFFNVTNYTLAPEAITTRQLLGTVVVGSGLNLNINNTGSTGNQTIGFFGNVTGGTLTLQGAPSSGNASRINISSGTLSSAVTINTTGVGNAGIVGFSTGAVVSGAIINSSTGNRTMIGATSGNDITLTSSAIISGSTGLQFAAGSSGGAGTVTLNSQSTYTGDTIFNTANTGVIKIGVSNALPTTTNVTMAFSNGNGGIFDLNGFNQEIASLTSNPGGSTGGGSIRNSGGGISTLTISGTASPAAFTLAITDGASSSGTVAITRSGTGSLTLSGVNTYSGPTTVTSGTLIAGGTSAFGAATGNLIAAGGVLNLGALGISRTGTVSLTGGTLQSGTLTNDVVAFDGRSGIVSAILSGSAGLTKTTSGVLVLGSANAYAGPTTLSAGTLRGGHNSALGSGTLALNGGTLTSGTDGVARSFANSVAIGGDIQFGDATATGGLTLSGPVNLGSGTRSLTVAQSTTLSGLVSNGGLIKAGAALLLLSSSNTYAAGTTVSTGTLKAGNLFSFGSGPVTLSAGATLDLSNFSIPNTITNNGGTLTNAASYSGTSSVSGTADYSGAVGGTVVVDAGGVANFSGSIDSLTVLDGGQANLNDGASLSQPTLTNNGLVAVNQAGNSTFSTAIGGSGAFEKLGSGILTVTGNSTYSGATTVSVGRLKVNGSLGSGGLSVAANAWLMGTGTINGPVTVSGTFAPGASPGVITLGSLVLTSTSTTLVEVAGTVRGTDYDGVTITAGGGVTYGGILQFAFGGSALPDGTYDIFEFTGSSNGSLASVESSGFYAGTWTALGSGTYQLVKDAQTITFSQSSGDVIVVPEPTAITLAAVGLGAMAYALGRRRRLA
jgi:autotransporter-associated beta strand protein